MKLPAIACILAFGLCSCADHAVRPSPTADQVIAEQYRAKGEHGAISGPEGTIITETYRGAIGKNTQIAPTGQTPTQSTIDENP